jgi:hypothetical protein
MPVRRADDVVCEIVDGRAVLLHPGGRELVTLSVVGSMVWEELASSGDTKVIARALHPRFEGVDLEQLEADTRSFLAELIELGLVVPTPSE